LERIVNLEVAKVIERIRAKEINLYLDSTAIEFLIEKGYDPAYGARPMRRAVERFLENPIAEELLRGKLKGGDQVDVKREGESLSFRTTKGDPVAVSS